MGLSERTLLQAMLLIGILNAIIYLPHIGINLSMPRRKSQSARMMFGNVMIQLTYLANLYIILLLKIE